MKSAIYTETYTHTDTQKILEENSQKCLPRQSCLLINFLLDIFLIPSTSPISSYEFIIRKLQCDTWRISHSLTPEQC